MIRPDSVPVWPEQVELREGHIFDAALDILHPVNETGQVLLGEVDGKRSIAEIVRTVCERYGWPDAEVQADLIETMAHLNREYLLNFRKPPLTVRLQNQLLRMLVLLRTLQAPLTGIRHRISLTRDGGWFGILRTITGAVLRSLGIQLLVIAALICGFLSALNLMNLQEAVFFTVSLYLGLILHETGHAVAFFRVSTPREQAFFCTKPGYLQIVHKMRPPRDELIISLAGPLVPGLCAVLLAIAVLTGIIPVSGEYAAWLPVAAFGVHLFSLVPPMADGKKIRSSLKLLAVIKQSVREAAPGKED
ncbi:PqqD family peptide modification chaperone [Staphylospora marina]|uniref:PqqD family peptide modification chaperone n=1 Tax=Staphylospora marina TaxID=2490858 RepID=UPI0013DDFA78|nr:PqqD family peptide modification chaperone [Staphylospora marina]